MITKEKKQAIMKEYAAIDRRFRILDVSGAEGYEQMMNLGLAQAKGEYIGLLEPQDYVSADMYERLWKQAKKHNLDLIQSNYTRFRIAADGKLETLCELDETPLDPSRGEQTFLTAATPSALT